MTTNNNNSISGNGGGVVSGSAILENKDNANDGDKDNPFEEYMWMGEEDEFNKQALEQIIEDDFIERCFEEMLEQEEMGMFDGAAAVDPVELMNNMNLGGVHENVVAAQDVGEGADERSSNVDGEEEDEAHNNEGGNQDTGENDNQDDNATEDNSEDSVSDIESDASSDAPLR